MKGFELGLFIVEFIFTIILTAGNILVIVCVRRNKRLRFVKIKKYINNKNITEILKILKGQLQTN